MSFKPLLSPCPLLICKSRMSSWPLSWSARCQMPENCGERGCNIVKHVAVYKPIYKGKDE